MCIILSMDTTTVSETDLLKAEVKTLHQNIKILEEQLDWFKKQLFGKKSERFIPDNTDVLYLPGLGPDMKIPDPAETKIAIPAHEKRKAKSTPINTISFPEDLPVEQIIIDLPEDKKIDSLGAPLVCIGEDVSRKLAKKPASYYVKEFVRKKYAAAGSPDEGIKTAFLPDSIIFRSAVDESILADILVKKFCDHLPLYRQAEMMLRDHIKISKQTLSSYVLQAGKALRPLYDLLEKQIKTSGNIFIDETPVDVLAPGTGKTDQGYMLSIVGGQSLDPALKIYKFFTSRKHEGFEQLFEGYQGVFHSDKYGAYEKEAKKSGKVWCPCMAHIRRKYVEAEGDPRFQSEILLYIQKLFDIEERCKNMSPEERLSIRKTEAEPVIDLIIQRNKERMQETLLPRSKIAKAIGYLIGLIPYLKNYLHHPYARLDNNVAERALKLVVIGRKNWLFIGREGGGEAAAIIYSLAQTCRALNINPYDYFNDVLQRIQGHPYSQLHELLPQNWDR